MSGTRIGLVGLGLIGRERLHALRALIAVGTDVEIVGVLDPGVSVDDPAISQVTTIDELSRREPDLVIVATPHDVATRLTERLIRGGSDVLVEKPLGRTLAEAQQVATVAAESGRTVYVGMNYRFFSGVRAMLDDAAAGWFGDLASCQMTLGHGGSPGDEESWKLDVVRAGGGCLIDPGIHLFDLAGCLGADAKVTAARTWSGFWRTGIEEASQIFLTSDVIPMIGIDLSIIRWRSTFRVELNGTDGYGIVTGRGRSYGPQVYRRGRRWGWRAGGSQADSEEEVARSDGSESFQEELVEILAGAAPKRNCDLAEGLRAMSLLEQARQVATEN